MKAKIKHEKFAFIDVISGQTFYHIAKRLFCGEK